MSIGVGIDLGTTNSVITYIDNRNKAVVIPNRSGNKITPSVICFQDNDIIIGDEAKELQELGIYDVVAFFKRQMGDDSFSFYSNNKEYSATELSSLILKQVKNDAENFLNQNIKDTVITVPAYFKEKERQATLLAGKKAGFNVLQIINEPTAAAIAYGVDKDENKTILVYDLGGGTFDVTILKISKNEIKILNSEGDHQLGGKDWDDRIISYIANQFEEEFGIDPLEDSESVADLLVRVENAKKKLSKLNETTISISYDGMKDRYVLSRDKLEELTSDLMERTVFLTQQAIDSIGLNVKDIDDILLVGGSTRMPMVHKFIKDRFHKNPLMGVNVDEAVSVGAALLAKELSSNNNYKLGNNAHQISLGNKKLTEVTNHTLGMIAISEDNRIYKNSPILPKNTNIPTSYTRKYNHRVSKNRENILEVFLTQGDSEIPNQVDYLNKYVVINIPYKRGGVVEIDVTYQYDINGVVNVEAFAEGRILPIKQEMLDNDIPDRFMREPEFENYVEREFMTIYMAFDISGSMSGSPLKQAKKAARSFVKNLDLDFTEIGIIVFSDTVKIIQHATNDEYIIMDTISDIECCKTGCCNDADPFDEIFSLMKNLEHKKYAIVLADGVWSYQDRVIKKAQKCHREDIEVVAIGFGGADKRFLQEIASSDEGSIFTTQEGLVDSFSTIAQEINHGIL